MKPHQVGSSIWRVLTEFNITKLLLIAGLIGVIVVWWVDSSLLYEAPRSSISNPGSVVRVFYGTDRKFDSQAQTFSGERGQPLLGAVEVSVPIDHRIGDIERPKWYLKHFVALDPEKHMVLMRQTVLSPDVFFEQVRALTRAEGDLASAFIFVHGYRVTFEDAALRTAQMAVDLRLPAVPVFYSWPSQGKTANYLVDEGNVEWAEPHLAKFLEDFADKSGAKTIHVVAHSMGARATSRALASLFKRRIDLAPRFKQLIFAAPDIDATVFKRDIAPALTAASRKVTLYASSNDKALMASRTMRGGYPRAGEAGTGLVVLSGVETVDATMIDTDFLGHSYYGDARPLLTDMALILGKGMSASDRPTLGPKNLGLSLYWEFRR